MLSHFAKKKKKKKKSLSGEPSLNNKLKNKSVKTNSCILVNILQQE